MMAVWTPGSYLVREYAAPRRAGHGRRAATAARWRSRRPTRTAGASTTGGAPTVTVSYRVYGREMSVRTNWVEARLRAAQRRADVPDAGRLGVRARTKSCSNPGGGLAPVDDRTAVDARRRASLSRRRLRHAGRLADPARQSRRSTSSPSTASRTTWSTRARPASSTARARRATSRRSSASTAGSGASCPYDKYVVLNLITEAAAAASSTRTPRC